MCASVSQLISAYPTSLILFSIPLIWMLVMDSVILNLFLQRAHDVYLGEVCLFSIITFNITDEHFTEPVPEDLQQL